MVFPPTEGGGPVSVIEIAEYLSSRNIAYDNKTLYALVGKEEVQKVIINKDTCTEEREGYKLLISPDKMQAVIRFYPPSRNGGKLTKKELLDDFNSKFDTLEIKVIQ